MLTSHEEFKNTPGVKINYSKEKFAGCTTIHPHTLLKESELVRHEIKLSEWKGLPVFFPQESGDIPFDIFSAVFYLVSRYEEYLPFQADKHDRFEAGQSLAVKGNFLRIPIVDLWCVEFARQLGIHETCKKIRPDNYKFCLTIDVDHAWVFKNRGVLFLAGSLAKPLILLKIKNLLYRLRIYMNRIPDPGNTYEYLFRIQNRLKEKIRFFILCSTKKKYDNNISLRNREFRNLITELNKTGIIGLHPSFGSDKSFGKLKKEYKKLEAILQQKVHLSRQHFLKLSFPDTYRNLIELGITEDHTMGYASGTGFRAGIARPFFFYDLFEEKQTSLRIVPFQVMDRTLLSYLNFTPEMAIHEFDHYSEIIKKVGGQFVSLWHNTSLSETEEWKGWKKVFEHMIKTNKMND
jgi:hypothetical protein